MVLVIAVPNLRTGIQFPKFISIEEGVYSFTSWFSWPRLFLFPFPPACALGRILLLDSAVSREGPKLEPHQNSSD